MENLVGNGTTRRLISNQYLHSNTNNFIASVRNQRNYLKSNQQHNKELISLRDRLAEMIKKTNDYVNLFYEDMGIMQRDIFSVETGTYNPIGAKAFSKKYLIDEIGQAWKKNAGKLSEQTDEKILLTIINSPQSIQQLRKITEEIERTFENEYLKWDDKQETLIKNLGELSGNKLADKLSEVTISQFENWLSTQIFVQNRRKGQTGLRLRSGLQVRESKSTREGSTMLYNQASEFQSILSQLKIPISDFSVQNEKSLRQLQTSLRQKLKDYQLYERIGGRYYDWIGNEFFRVTGRKIHKKSAQKRQKFSRFFAETVSNYTNIDLLSINNESGIKGFLLEFGIYASFNLMRASGEDVVKILGQDQVTREYLSSTFSSFSDKQKIEEKTEQKTGQSASDISFIGKNRRRYNFQLKNNFNEDKAALSFRAKANIDVSTYLPTAIQGDDNLLEILQYLLINTAFLKQYGLGKYSSNGSQDFLFKSNNIPKEVSDYILFFLQQTYEFLLGTQYDKNIRDFGTKNAGNLAYIFQGKYFIPIASYLFSAYEMLNKILKNNYRAKKETYQMSGIGGISGIPNFKNVDIGLNNRTFQKEKIEKILPQTRFKNQFKNGYRYPESLINYGGYYGRTLYNKLEFERINITLIIDNLEKILKR